MTAPTESADPHARFRRAVPADFAARAVAMSDHDLRRHYVAGQSTIKRWRVESGAEANLFRRRPNLQMPADFAEIAKGMTIGQAADYFHRNRDTIRRWFGYAGIAPSEQRIAPTKAVIRSEVDASEAGLAAHHLRRFYASVHRADIRLDDRTRRTWGDAHGAADGGRGQYFVSGLGVMPDYELIGLARDHGFGAGA